MTSTIQLKFRLPQGLFVITQTIKPSETEECFKFAKELIADAKDNTTITTEEILND